MATAATGDVQWNKVAINYPLTWVELRLLPQHEWSFHGNSSSWKPGIISAETKYRYRTTMTPIPCVQCLHYTALHYTHTVFFSVKFKHINVSLIPRPSHVFQRTCTREKLGRPGWFHDVMDMVCDDTHWYAWSFNNACCSLLKIKMSVDDYTACDCLPSPQFTKALWKVKTKI